MNKLSKLILSIVGILNLIAAIWFAALLYPIEYISDFVKGLPMNEQYMQVVGLTLASVIALTGLSLCFWVLISAKIHKDVEYKTNKGQLVLSKNAIEKTITNDIKENYDLRDVDVSVKLLGKKMKANISAITSENNNLLEYGKNIEKFSNEKLHELVGIPVKKVIVKLSSIDSNNNKNNSRVV